MAISPIRSRAVPAFRHTSGGGARPSGGLERDLRALQNALAELLASGQPRKTGDK